MSAPAGLWHTMVTGHPQGTTVSGMAQMEDLGRTSGREAEQDLRSIVQKWSFPPCERQEGNYR